MTGFIRVVVMLGIVCLLWYLWNHKTGTIARGIGAAGATYNDIYGFGGPPRIPPCY